MIHIKKIPKKFVVCDGMTQDFDFVSHFLILIIILIGIPIAVYLYVNWKELKNKIKGKNEKNKKNQQ